MLSIADKHSEDQAFITDRALPIGTTLSHDQFTITDHLGAGGFGITYRAMDNVLGRTIVIKECFPEACCVRDGKDVVARNKSFTKPVRSVVKMFMHEARSLAKLRHPNIVGVHRVFEENGTAYMVLDLIDGRDFFNVLEVDGIVLSPKRVKAILLQILDAVETVHELDLLHRDISPDNIIIEKNGTPVLIDFGAARGDANNKHTRAVSAFLVIKDGYSPQEFYTPGSEQSPCSDIYALGATFYHAISGKPPLNSQKRMIEIAGGKPDPCVPLAGRISGYDQAFLEAIDTAMKVHPDDRIQSAAKWKSLITLDASDALATEAGLPATVPDISLELELSLTKLVEETNSEVKKTSEATIEPKLKVIVPERQTSKPEWVDEFNQESIADGRNRPKGTPMKARIPSRKADQPAPSLAKKSDGETNWVNRALAKQDRVRSEMEAQFDLLDPEVTDRVKSKPNAGQAEATEELADTAVEEAAPQLGKMPLRIAVGLVVCFCFASFFSGP